MSRFGTILTTKALVKSHLIEARIRIERKEIEAAVPHLLRAIEAQQTAVNCLTDLLSRPRERKIVKPRGIQRKVEVAG
jgi:hypothetical protein